MLLSSIWWVLTLWQKFLFTVWNNKRNPSSLFSYILTYFTTLCFFNRHMFHVLYTKIVLPILPWLNIEIAVKTNNIVVSMQSLLPKLFLYKNDDEQNNSNTKTRLCYFPWMFLSVVKNKYLRYIITFCIWEHRRFILDKK